MTVHGDRTNTKCRANNGLVVLALTRMNVYTVLVTERPAITMFSNSRRGTWQKEAWRRTTSGDGAVKLTVMTYRTVLTVRTFSRGFYRM